MRTVYEIFDSPEMLALLAFGLIASAALWLLQAI